MKEVPHNHHAVPHFYLSSHFSEIQCGYLGDVMSEIEYQTQVAQQFLRCDCAGYAKFLTNF